MDNPLASLLGLGGGGATTLAALASLAGSQIADGRGGGGGGRRDSGRDHDRDGGGTVGLNMTSTHPSRIYFSYIVLSTSKPMYNISLSCPAETSLLFALT